MNPLLQIENLRVTFKSRRGEVHAVRGIDLSINEGETLALVGESGCGKSMTALSIMGLIQPPGEIDEGVIKYRNNDLRTFTSQELEKIRGKEISMIFQEPMTSLNPVMTIGSQINETLQSHFNIDKSEATRQAEELMAKVGIPNPAERIGSYPHQLSGGLRQRAMIAMALACSPKILIADEPTTALDVTIQAQILNLLRKLSTERSMSLLLISHDLGVVRNLADRVAIMYQGLIVEHGDSDSIFLNPQHPYTQGLIECIPRQGNFGLRLKTLGNEIDGDEDTLSLFPAEFQPQGDNHPPLSEVSPGHLVRRWR